MTDRLMGLLMQLPPVVVLLAVALLPALEASALVGLVIPGETAVFVGGLIAHQGHLPLWEVIVAAAAGAVIGDQVGFALGRRVGPALFDRLPRRLRASGRVDDAFGFIQRRGAWAVLLGRWTALLRALVPSIAGASGLRRRTFSIANVIGGVSWALTVALVGFGAGAAYRQVAATMGRASEIAVALVVIAGFVFLASRNLHRGRDRLSPTRRVAPTDHAGGVR